MFEKYLHQPRTSGNTEDTRLHRMNRIKKKWSKLKRSEDIHRKYSTAVRCNVKVSQWIERCIIWWWKCERYRAGK